MGNVSAATRFYKIMSLQPFVPMNIKILPERTRNFIYNKYDMNMYRPKFLINSDYATSCKRKC